MNKDKYYVWNGEGSANLRIYYYSRVDYALKRFAAFIKQGCKGCELIQYEELD